MKERAQRARERGSLPWLLRDISKLHKQAVRVRQAFAIEEEPGQPLLLLMLARANRNNQSLSQNDLAHMIGVSDPTITASLKSLERQGYIKREADPNDLRRKLCVLTEKGEAIAERSRISLDYVDNGMLNGFSQEDKETLCNLLQRVVDNLTEIIEQQ